MAYATFRFYSHVLCAMMLLEIGGRTAGPHSDARPPFRKGGATMTLTEIALGYQEAAVPLRARLKELRMSRATACWSGRSMGLPLRI